MARAIHKLSDYKVKSLKEGRHSDGGGLYLRVSATGSKSWSFMFNRAGKRQEIGLGPYPALSLSAARKIASENRETLVLGGTPKKPSEAREKDKTFEEASNLFLASMEKQWGNQKHRAQWRMTLGPAYCKPLLNMRVSDIAVEDVLRTLKPHWTSKAETASRVRGRIERVLSFAKAQGWCEGENPAAWKGNLDAILPQPKKLSRGHMKAIPYADLPDFMEGLREAQTVSAKALEFLILTASRSGEVLKARWQEFDLETKVWTIPAERMKAKREHRVPMSEDAMSILASMHELRQSEFVFPGSRAGSAMSDMTLTQLLRRKGRSETVHGMRSSFRDWAGDETSFPREVAEAALAHSVGNAVEQAYRRSDALEKRRELLSAWAQFLGPEDVGQVVHIQRKASQ